MKKWLFFQHNTLFSFWSLNSAWILLLALGWKQRASKMENKSGLTNVWHDKDWKDNDTTQQFRHQNVSIKSVRSTYHTHIKYLFSLPPFEKTWQRCPLLEWAECLCDRSHFHPSSHSKDMTQHCGWLAADTHCTMLFIEKPTEEALLWHYSVLATTASKISQRGSLPNNGWDQISKAIENKKEKQQSDVWLLNAFFDKVKRFFDKKNIKLSYYSINWKI